MVKNRRFLRHQFRHQFLHQCLHTPLHQFLRQQILLDNQRGSLRDNLRDNRLGSLRDNRLGSLRDNRRVCLRPVLRQGSLLDGQQASRLHLGASSAMKIFDTVKKCRALSIRKQYVSMGSASARSGATIPTGHVPRYLAGTFLTGTYLSLP